MLLEPEEIDAIKLESKRTIDLMQFVDAKEIDYRYFERPYFLVPADEMSGEGYAVFRHALLVPHRQTAERILYGVASAVIAQ